MWKLDIENIAGIHSGETTIQPGFNVVQAENWQGKSSFITAIQVAMGGTGMDETHPLTDGTTEGSVEIDTETESYETVLERDGDRVVRRGDTYLTDTRTRVCANLFAFLGEDNPIRQTVRDGGDLASQLVRPLELEDIEGQLEQLTQERRTVESELEDAETASRRLTEVRQTIAELENDLAELRDRREHLADDRTERPQTDSQAELSEKQARRDQLRSRKHTLTDKIERQEETLADYTERLDDIEVPDDPDSTTDVEEIREEIRELEAEITLLDDLARINKRILDEGRTDVVTDIERTLAGDEMSCWVCGAATSADQVEAQLAAVEEQGAELRARKQELERDIEELQQRREAIREAERERRQLEEKIDRLEVKVEEDRAALADVEDELAAVGTEIESLQEAVSEADERLTDIESEIKYTERELDRKRAEADDLAEVADKRETLETQVETLTDEIETLRTRREKKKRELVERFDQTMDEIIDIFEPGFETARLDPKVDETAEITAYELVIARDGEETDIDALSEGEVELLGIVAALAGYETFSVSEKVPVVLLDGLATLSESNFRALVSYLSEKSEYFVTTAHPEIGDVGDHTISPEEWDVVSHHQSRPA